MAARATRHPNPALRPTFLVRAGSAGLDAQDLPDDHHARQRSHALREEHRRLVRLNLNLTLLNAVSPRPWPSRYSCVHIAKGCSRKF
eukprot:1545962-Prymnesium_polylepis.1